MTKQMAIKEVVFRIVDLNKSLAEFWGKASGWAPTDAANLLSRSRLDWQVSLSESLGHWTGRKKLSDGDLILAWANLGSLVEGTMKLFLSVHYDDYKKDIFAIRKRGQLVDPDQLMLEHLKQFFKTKEIFIHWNKFVELVQQRRNAVHAFRTRKIGTHSEFCKTVIQYHEFLLEIKADLPYPD